MDRIKLSRYAVPIEKDGKYLLFSTKRCNFYEVDRESYEFLLNLDLSEEECKNDTELSGLIKDLKEKGLVSTRKEDIDYYENEKVLFSINSYSNNNLGLTIAPTVTCNLRCPYCFETIKPTGIMTTEVADQILEFVKQHEVTQNISISWYGGEPLMGWKTIEYLLPKLFSIEGKPVKGHSMITNGTLLKGEILEMFKKYPLDNVQITLDGFRENHNKKRFYSTNCGSFDDIIENIDNFTKECPNTSVSIRINIDNSNSDDYAKVVNFLNSRFEGRKVSWYAGILRANPGCESETFFSTKDHLDFYKSLRQQGIMESSYPYCSSKGCSATSINSYIIGPRGELYKCWEHMGDSRYEIGSINGKAWTNPSLYNEFILRGHCFDDEKCRECALLPICFGGCPNKRLQNNLEGANHNLCTIYKDDNENAIKEMLIDYFHIAENQTKY